MNDLPHRHALVRCAILGAALAIAWALIRPHLPLWVRGLVLVTSTAVVLYVVAQVAVGFIRAWRADRRTP